MASGDKRRHWKNEMVIYVGDAKQVAKRIIRNHCSGNVEGSALRRHIAVAKAFRISNTKRRSGTTRVRIDSEDPKQSEEAITAYLRGGSWQIVPCSTYEEANDLQWFLIDRLNPVCNVTRKAWDRGRTGRYQRLMEQCFSGPAMTFTEVQNSGLSVPGVYVFEHLKRPDA